VEHSLYQEYPVFIEAPDFNVYTYLNDEYVINIFKHYLTEFSLDYETMHNIHYLHPF